jgi:hypothetical protein
MEKNNKNSMSKKTVKPEMFRLSPKKIDFKINKKKENFNLFEDDKFKKIAPSQKNNLLKINYNNDSEREQNLGLIKIETKSQEMRKNYKNDFLDHEKNLVKNVMMTNLKKNKLSLGTTRMMENERIHALEAIETGIYVTWVSKEKPDVACFRIGYNSVCICTHGFASHEKIVTKKKFSSKCTGCKCRAFTYIPIYPEEIGEYWIPYQPNFNYSTWKAKCKCKHSWTEHNGDVFFNCKLCSCHSFNSNFCCVVCDKFWQDHEMLYELEHERYMIKKQIGEDFMPFSEMPEISGALFKFNKLNVNN